MPDPTQQGVEWWLPKFKQRFDVLVLQSIPSGFALVVKSKRSKVALSAPQSLVLPGMPQTKAARGGTAARPSRDFKPAR